MAPRAGSVASSISFLASPMRAGTSVSSSINPAVRMISIGPEGGKARVDTSFGNPFARMRPSDPTLNRGQIFGENGSPKPSKIDSRFGSSLNVLKPTSPTPRPRFTTNLNSQMDIQSTFARAKARNQELNASKKAEKINNPVGLGQSERGRERVLRAVNNPRSSIDFKRFQTIPQVKLPDQEGPANTGFKKTEFKSITIPLENQKNDPIIRSARPAVQISTPELKAMIADFVVTNRRFESHSVSRQQFESVIFATPQPKGERLIIKSTAIPESIMSSSIEPIKSAVKLTTDDRRLMSHSEVALVTEKQRNTLIALAPLLKEGDQAVKERVVQTVGVSKEAALAVIEALPSIGTTIKVTAEVPPQDQSQSELQQAKKAVQLTNQLAGFSFKEGESEEELAKKAKALIATIRQTYQLQGLANSDAQMQQLVERQLDTSDIISRKVRSKFSLLLVSLVKEVRVQQAAKPLTEPQTSKEGLHQVDLEKQNIRATLAIKSITEAPQNQNGDSSRDYVIGQFVAHNNESIWGGLAIRLKQGFDGTVNELVNRLKKAKEWVSPQSLAKTIDETMAEFPAVEPASKQTTKLVGVKEVGKVMDPNLTEILRSMIVSLVTTPKTISQAATV